MQPTAIHRATEASDLAKYPESGVTQEKKADVKHNHHWTEANSTTSEADVSTIHEGQILVTQVSFLTCVLRSGLIEIILLRSC